MGHGTGNREIQLMKAVLSGVPAGGFFVSALLAETKYAG